MATYRRGAICQLLPSDQMPYPNPAISADGCKRKKDSSFLAANGSKASANDGKRRRADVSVGPSAKHQVSKTTERAGFEPAIGFKPDTAFPVLLLQPLGHLSGGTNGGAILR